MRLGSDKVPHVYVNLLAEYRRREGLTQQQLADAAGMTVSGLQKLEAAKHRPRPATARRLAKALHGQVRLIFPYGTQAFKPSAEKLAAMQEGRRRAQAEETREALVEKRQCIICKRYKDRKEFTTNYRTLKSGERRAYVGSRCHKCEAARVAQYRKDNPDKIKKTEKRKRNTERYRTYQREWAAAKRRQQGKPVRSPYVKRRGTYTTLDSEPFLAWWDGGGSWPELDDQDPSAARAIRRSRPDAEEADGTPGKIGLAVVDHVLTLSGRPDMLSVLYPE